MSSKEQKTPEGQAPEEIIMDQHEGEVRRVWGAPQQAFLQGLRPCKNSKCAHTCPACRNVRAPK